MDDTPVVGLGINDSIRVALVHPDGVEGDRVHTYVQDISDSALTVPIPTGSGVLLYFPRGCRAAIYTVRDDALYRGGSWVLRVTREGGRPVMEMSVPDTYERVQRREYVRWECTLNVQWWSADPAADEDRGNAGRGVTVNISCGGMLVACDGPLTIGTECHFEIFLPDATVQVVGRPLRSESGPGEDPSFWAVEFTSIEIRDQDRIMSFIFNEQLRLRRLGLL